MRPLGVLAFVGCLALTVGCADTREAPPDSGLDSVANDGQPDYGFGDLGPLDQFIFPDGFEIGKAVVYAQTPDELFEVDPESLEVSPIAAFAFPANEDSPRMTDIALDKDGKMIGVTRTSVYSVDPETAVCTRLSSNSVHYVGLSYVVDTSTPDKTEFLMGLDKDGTVYKIDPQTGETTPRGGLGTDPVVTDQYLRAAGDIVSVRGLNNNLLPTSTTLVTLERPTPYDGTDWLAWVDTGTGEAVIIGDTGYAGIWGLGFWKVDNQNKVFGFTTEGEFLLIDVQTGKATLHSQNVDHVWWGAGVTTDAPTID